MNRPSKNNWTQRSLGADIVKLLLLSLSNYSLSREIHYCQWPLPLWPKDKWRAATYSMQLEVMKSTQSPEYVSIYCCEIHYPKISWSKTKSVNHLSQYLWIKNLGRAWLGVLHWGLSNNYREMRWWVKLEQGIVSVGSSPGISLSLHVKSFKYISLGFLTAWLPQDSWPSYMVAGCFVREWEPGISCVSFYDMTSAVA